MDYIKTVREKKPRKMMGLLHSVTGGRVVPFNYMEKFLGEVDLGRSFYFGHLVSEDCSTSKWSWQLNKRVWREEVESEKYKFGSHQGKEEMGAKDWASGDEVSGISSTSILLETHCGHANSSVRPTGLSYLGYHEPLHSQDKLPIYRPGQREKG